MLARPRRADAGSVADQSDPLPSIGRQSDCPAPPMQQPTGH